MAKRMTEEQAMRELVGRPATVTEPTQTGTQTVVGVVTTPLLIEEEGVTHVTVEGMITHATITGVPMPVSVEEPARLEMIPLETVELL